MFCLHTVYSGHPLFKSQQLPLFLNHNSQYHHHHCNHVCQSSQPSTSPFSRGQRRSSGFIPSGFHHSRPPIRSLSPRLFQHPPRNCICPFFPIKTRCQVSTWMSQDQRQRCRRPWLGRRRRSQLIPKFSYPHFIGKIKYIPSPDSPIFFKRTLPLLYLLLFDNFQPGLTGGSGDGYVRHMLVRARKKGWRVVVFNSRGCGHSPVTTPQVSTITTQHHILLAYLQDWRTRHDYFSAL